MMLTSRVICQELRIFSINPFCLAVVFHKFQVAASLKHRSVICIYGEDIDKHPTIWPRFDSCRLYIIVE